MPHLGRALVVLLACVVLSGALATRVHDVVARHVVCPEHGHLEELHHSDRPTTPLAGLISGRTAATAHTQDHGCLFLAGFFSSRPPAQEHAAVPAVAGLLREPSLPAGAPRVPPLRFAPKTSPPLA